MSKINIPREKQLIDTKENTWYGQTMQECYRSMPPLVNIVTFGIYVGVSHISQEQF